MMPATSDPTDHLSRTGSTVLRHRLVPAVTAACVAVAAAGCGTAGSGGGAAGGDGGGDDTATAAMDGEWTLTSGNGPDGDVPVGDGVEVTLVIDGSAWSGHACNRYSGEVEIDGDAVSIPAMARTEMGCLDDRVTEAETTYHAALGVVTTVTVAEDALTLAGDDAELVFERVPPIPDANLAGTTWVLESLVLGAGPDGAASSVVGDAELILETDGTFRFGTGCNQGGGTYTVVEDTIAFEQAADTTAVDCGGSGPAQEQEDHVMSVLDGEVAFEVVEDRLTLTGDDGGLVYRAIESGSSDG